jgi:hypothetical protein
MNAETPLTNSIRLGVVDLGVVLFRNLVGKFQTAQGGWVKCGLGPGSSDTVGWTRVVVTQAMVGQPLAVFTAIEVKVPGARTEPERLEQQRSFVAAVQRDGGIAGFATSVAAARAVIRGWVGRWGRA